MTARRHGSSRAPTHRGGRGAGAGTPGHRATAGAWLARVSLPLCFGALLLSCTDPRARVAPPSIQLIVSPALQPTSPGLIPASIVLYDQEGLDSLDVSVRSAVPALNGDSLYLLPDTIQMTQNIVWAIPSGVPAGTRITLAAKVWNVIGFSAADSAILTSQ